MSKKVLIIEDTQMIRDMIKAFLEEEGFSVIAVNDGQAGLDAVAEQIPDIIISDYLMPEMDGFTFFKELKKDEALAKIPVIILTSRAKTEDTFMVYGANSFISKTDSIDVLLPDLKAEVDKLLGSKQEEVGQGTEPQEESKKAESASTVGVPSSGAEGASAVLFCQNDDVRQEITGKLEKESIEVTAVKEYSPVVNLVKKLAPSVIILQLNVDDNLPIDQKVSELSIALQSLALEKKEERCEPAIVIFKAQEKAEGIDTSNAAAVDIDNMLINCKNNWEKIEYVGDYSSVSFLGKVQPLLKKSES